MVVPALPQGTGAPGVGAADALQRKLTRETVLLALGSIGFLHEVFVYGTERPFVLTACLAMMGLSIGLAANGRNK